MIACQFARVLGRNNGDCGKRVRAEGREREGEKISC